MVEKLTRVQRRQRETKEHIFRIAMDLFRQKGFEHTTVTEITEAADIGKGTFFIYFPTKEAVFGHLGEMLTEAMSTLVDEGIRAMVPIPALIRQLFDVSAAWHENNRSLSEQVVMSGLRLGPVMDADASNQQRLLQLFGQLIQAGQARGELRKDIRPEDGALVLSGAYFSTVVGWLRGVNEARSLSERFGASLDLVFRGMGA